MQKTIDLKAQTVCLNDEKVRRADCQHCTLRHRMLFSNLDMDSFSNSLWPINHMVSKAKTKIYYQGQPPQSIYSIRQGFIKLVQLTESGQQRIVRILGPGSCIGLEALIGHNYNQTAEAITEIDYCTIPIKSIFQIEQQQPNLYIDLQKQWQKQLDDADIWLTQLVTGPIKQRLCRFLIMQHQLQKPSNDQVTLISNQDIASILSTSEETISRCLSDMRKKMEIERIEKRSYRLSLEDITCCANM